MLKFWFAFCFFRNEFLLFLILSDFDFLKEGEEADSIQNIKHLKNRLFPKVEQTKHDNHDEKGR